MKEKAATILAEINKAKSILLSCHPSPDPDSVGSSLAMKFALESVGKKVTVIKGDSVIPQGFMHFPGATEIVMKNFFEIDLKDYDLYIILDSGAPEMISRVKPVIFPLPIRTLVIDHHPSNKGYADVNFVEPSYQATCAILYDLFNEWGIKIYSNIAANLYVGIYTDTGGFRYENNSARTLAVAAALAEKIPSTSELISKMENNESASTIAFFGKAFSSISVCANGHVAICALSYEDMTSLGIADIGMRGSTISSKMRIVADWYITGSMIEVEPGKVKCSFRSKDEKSYDVSKLAMSLGGGGHKMAAGAFLNMSLEEAKKCVVSKAEELYNL